MIIISYKTGQALHQWGVIINKKTARKQFFIFCNGLVYINLQRSKLFQFYHRDLFVQFYEHSHHRL